jgi:hypothetical protein
MDYWDALISEETNSTVSSASPPTQVPRIGEAHTIESVLHTKIVVHESPREIELTLKEQDLEAHLGAITVNLSVIVSLKQCSEQQMEVSIPTMVINTDGNSEANTVEACWVMEEDGAISDTMMLDDSPPTTTTTTTTTTEKSSSEDSQHHN